MTKKEEFYTLYKKYEYWDKSSLSECIQRLRELYSIWSEMRKNAREDTRDRMTQAITNCLYRISHLDQWERKKNFEKLRKEIPDMDYFFACLDKNFPRTEILYKLSNYGYTKQ